MKSFIKGALLTAFIFASPFIHESYIVSKNASIRMISFPWMRATGFFMKGGKSGRTYLITARHVCLSTPPQFVVAMSPTSDVCALVAGREKNPTTLKFARSATNFEVVYAYGYPYGETLTLTKGNFAGALYVDQFKAWYWVMTAQIYPGNSGSPVLNKYGHVVGLVSAGWPYTNRGYAVPLYDLKAFVDSL